MAALVAEPYQLSGSGNLERNFGLAKHAPLIEEDRLFPFEFGEGTRHCMATLCSDFALPLQMWSQCQNVDDRHASMAHKLWGEFITGFEIYESCN